MIKQTYSITSSQKRSTDQFDSKCVCQICTCHKHKCPHSNPNIPFEEISTYQKEYVRHPLVSTQKMSTDNAKYLQTPYGYMNSSYREDYPGHKPEMRQKIVPRVKNEEKNISFAGETWYQSTYKPQSTKKDKIRNKDKEFNPCLQPFQGLTTYKSDFFPKRPHSQLKKQAESILYPEGYKFNGNTTYTNDFIEKALQTAKSFKPMEKIPDKGKHFLNSTYRDDFTQKKSIEICPVLTLPKYPSYVKSPSQHISFDKNTGSWEAN